MMRVRTNLDDRIATATRSQADRGRPHRTHGDGRRVNRGLDTKAGRNVLIVMGRDRRDRGRGGFRPEGLERQQRFSR